MFSIVFCVFVLGFDLCCEFAIHLQFLFSRVHFLFGRKNVVGTIYDALLGFVPNMAFMIIFVKFLGLYPKAFTSLTDFGKTDLKYFYLN